MATLSRPLQWQYDSTIRWINRQLRQTTSHYHVEELEPGDRCSYTGCPIAQAFKAAGAVRVSVAPDKVTCWLTPVDDFRIRQMEFKPDGNVRAFIKNFDQRRFKALLKEEKSTYGTKRGRR